MRDRPLVRPPYFTCECGHMSSRGRACNYGAALCFLALSVSFSFSFSAVVEELAITARLFGCAFVAEPAH
jgi:hypothetical protein